MKKVMSVATSALLALTGTVAASQTANAEAAPYDVKLSRHMYGQTNAAVGLRSAALAVQEKSNWQGGTIFVDGQYNVSSIINLDEVVGTPSPDNTQKVWNKIRVVGSGVGSSKLTKTTNGAMFKMYRNDICHEAGKSIADCNYTGTYLDNLGYQDIGFEVPEGITGYIWELGSGAITNSSWNRIRVDVRGRGGVMYVGKGTIGKGGAQYHSNSWRDSQRETHDPTNYYIPMRFVSAGHFINGNLFDRLWVHSHKNDRRPFFLLQPSGGIGNTSNGGRYTNTSFRSITGEQNLGGLIHTFGLSGLNMDAIAEWDGVCPGYASSIIGVNPNGGTVANGISLSGSGQLAYNYAPVRNGARTVWIAPGTTNVNVQGTPVNQTIPITGDVRSC